MAISDNGEFVVPCGNNTGDMGIMNPETVVLSVTDTGGGINVDNVDPAHPVVSNTGVHTVAGSGSGIDVSGPTSTRVVMNTGVHGVTGTGDGIMVDNGDSNNPVVSNTGVHEVMDGNAIQVTGTVQNPIITNNGVRTLSEGDGITVDNSDSNNPIVSNNSCTKLFANFHHYNSTHVDVDFNGTTPQFMECSWHFI